MLHKGYEVWLTCDGEPLQEYQKQAEGDDGKTVACYIPSESGKTFAIHWQDHVHGNYLHLTFVLDGNKLGHGSLCLPGKSGKRAGALVRADTEQTFQFTDLRTTDDEALLDGISSNADLGSIQVSVKRVHGHCTKVPYTPATFDPVGAVHERSKKAGAHTVALGKATKIAGAPAQFLERHDPIDPDEGYIAIFNFRYRPRALLQAQGVIPLSQEPTQPQAGPSRVPKTERKRISDAADDRATKRPKPEPDAEKLYLGVIEISDDEDFDMSQAQRRKPAQKAQKVKTEPRRSSNHGLGDTDVIDLTLDD